MDFANLPSARQEYILECLLNNFPNSRWYPPAVPLRDGASGAGVFHAYFSETVDHSPGLNGRYVVKIGPADWAHEQEQRYRDIRVNGMEAVVVDYCGSTLPFECDGYAAVVSKPALESHFTQSLRALVKDPEASSRYAREIPDHIGAFLAKLAKWNHDKPPVSNDERLTPFEMIYKMLGDKLARVLPRLVTAPLCWHIDARQLEELFITPDRWNARSATRPELPNPLAFLRNVAWYEIRNQQTRQTSPHWLDFLTERYPCPIGRIHGDLNTSNIICRTAPDTSSVECPVVVDFDDFKPDGVPFYDYAYLEIDVLFHCLPPDRLEHRTHWLELLAGSMGRSIVPEQDERVSAEVRQSLSYIQPIRKAVRELCTGNPPYERNIHEERELAWWAATVAAGLNFASKEKLMTGAKRKAALLYAAYGLQRLFQSSGGAGDLNVSTAPLIMPWFLDGEIDDGRTLEAWELGRQYLASVATHRAERESSNNQPLRVHLLLSQPTTPSTVGNHWVGLNEELAQKRADMARRLKEERYIVTSCTPVQLDTQICSTCELLPMCSHSRESEAVILLVEDEAMQPATLLERMGVPPHKTLVLVPRHTEQFPVGVANNATAEIVYFAPKDHVVQPAQNNNEVTRSPNRSGDDLTNNYVVAKVLQYARKRSFADRR
jgi:hypothetical protein